KAALLPDIAGPSIVVPQTPQLAAALDRAFAEPDKSTMRHTRAIVVMKDGRVIAERYADGIGVDTPLLGFSATKSVMSALAGILVRRGALKLHEPVPIAAWQGAGAAGTVRPARHAPRHARIRRLGQCGRIEPVARQRARLGPVRPAPSQRRRRRRKAHPARRLGEILRFTHARCVGGPGRGFL